MQKRGLIYATKCRQGKLVPVEYIIYTEKIYVKIQKKLLTSDLGKWGLLHLALFYAVRMFFKDHL